MSFLKIVNLHVVSLMAYPDPVYIRRALGNTCTSGVVHRVYTQLRAPPWYCCRAPETRTLVPPFKSSQPLYMVSRLWYLVKGE